MLEDLTNALRELAEDLSGVDGCVLRGEAVLAYSRLGLDKDATNWTGNLNAQDVAWVAAVQSTQIEVSQRTRLALLSLASSVLDVS